MHNVTVVESQNDTFSHRMTTRIPAGSRQQAMDWSLVLVSQRIETTIASDAEQGWGLIVPAQDSQRAIRTLRQYHLENRRWPWQRPLSENGFLFDWTSMLWVVLITLFYWLEGNMVGLREAGAMNAAAVSRGEWWRLFTAVFLHADVAHLVANAGIGLILLGLTMGRYGTGIGVLAAYLAGVIGNVATWLLFERHHSLGASGMVMGCIGLLAVQSLAELFHRDPESGARPARSAPTRWNRRGIKYAISGLAGGAMLFVLVGLNPTSDVLAHFGGFIGGILVGCVLVWIPNVAQKKVPNICAAVLFCLLTILAWWRALAAGS